MSGIAPSVLEPDLWVLLGEDDARPARRQVAPPSVGATVVGVVAALVTAAAYAIHVGRGLDYDSAETVGFFVHTPSVLDAFRRQRAFNNHPLFSALDHVVGILTGSYSPAAMRLLPIACSALAVGLLGFLAARRFGVVSGAVAAVILATNGMLVVEGRAVRGYSLLVLATVASTALVARMVRDERRDGRFGWRLGLLYAVVSGAGIADHAYMVGPIVMQVAAVGAAHLRHADRERTRRWALVWVRTAIVGLLAYIRLAKPMFAADRGRLFHLWFPLQLVRDLGGGHWWEAAVLLPLAAAGLWRHADRVLVVALAVGFGVLLLCAWATAPADLYPRFFIWAVPAVGWGAGAAASRVRWPGLAAAALSAMAVLPLVPGPSAAPLPLAQAARLIRADDAAGLRPCVLGESAEPLVGYLPTFTAVTEPSQLDRCTTAYWLTANTDAALVQRAEARFRRAQPLPAEFVGLRLSDPS